jgi:tRNA pseudouridine65 synthase
LFLFEGYKLTSMPLQVLFQNEKWIAIEKPAGLFVHPSFMGKRDEPSAMKILRDQLGQWVYPVHRLDRPTSGVLLFGLSPEAAEELAVNFRERQMKKTYYAVVRGWTPKSGVITKPIRKIDDDGNYEEIEQEATTEYECLETFELPFSVGVHPTSRFSFVKVHPVTGRRHQIRRHMASISHPLIGDVLYGDGKYNRLYREKTGVHRLMLHCAEMEIPTSEQTVTISSPLPAEFTSRRSDTRQINECEVSRPLQYPVESLPTLQEPAQLSE